MADVGVHLVGEIQRGRADGEIVNLTLRSDYVDAIVQELGAELIQEILAAFALFLPGEHLA